MGEVSDPGGEERLGGRSRRRMRGCVLLGGPHFTHPLSPGERKLLLRNEKFPSQKMKRKSLVGNGDMNRTLFFWEKYV